MADPATTPDPSTVAWAKIQGYLEKLFNALDDLDEAGGVRAAAEAGGWSPKARAKALGSLEAVRGQIEAALSRAGAGPTRSSGKGEHGRAR